MYELNIYVYMCMCRCMCRTYFVNMIKVERYAEHIRFIRKVHVQIIIINTNENLCNRLDSIDFYRRSM